MLHRRRVLGLAVTGRCITAVEVVPANGGGRAGRAAAFALPETVGLDKPVALGKALKQFLRNRGFSGSRCVIGIEAGGLTAKEKALPPAAGDAAAKMLSLMVEREFGTDHKGLVFDYALGAGDAERRAALLVAAPQSTLDHLVAMARAAGLNLTAVTASALALTEATDGASGRQQLILHLFEGGAELALRTQGGIGMMRRLPIGLPGGDGMVGELADELRRVVALLPGAPADAEPARELLIWDETGLRPADCDVLSARLALPVKTCARPNGLAPAAEADSRLPGAQYLAAAAMALSAARGRSPVVDLLHSRLASRRQLGIGRKAAWAGAAIAALVLAGVLLAVSWHNEVVEVAALTAQLNAMEGDRAEAANVIDKVNYARPWYDRRPSYLDCIREVTLAFPQEGLIWTTSLAVQEDMQIVLSGKAVSESAVLDVLDRLKANPGLSNVKQLYLRQAGRQGREVAFAMSFAFTQSDKTWSSPNAKD